ncbi:hypothetical protein DL96DRAFT_1702126 [Flagelloscypha sp. PMI_526]|nr:hypothetical protein DL96DRAFT_1702126 [Flagelloscypha sp. PMI_526]
MGQDTDYIHAWLNCTSRRDDAGFTEPARGESPVLGLAFEEDALLSAKPALTSHSSTPSLRPLSSRLSLGQGPRTAVYLPERTDSQLDRLTQLLAALPPSPVAPMYSLESANSSQVWIGSSQPSPIFSSDAVKKAKSHATFASTSTRTSYSFHSPASSVSLGYGSPTEDDEAVTPAHSDIIPPDGVFYPVKSRWSLASSGSHEMLTPPAPKKERRTSGLAQLQVQFPLSEEAPPPPPKDWLPSVPSSPLETVHQDDTQKQKKRKRFYSFITSATRSHPSSPTPPSPAPSSPTTTPTPSDPSQFPSPYSCLPASCSAAYLSSLDDESQDDDPFSGSRFAHSTLPPLHSADASTVGSLGSVGTLAPVPVPFPASAPPVRSKRNSFGFGLASKRSSVHAGRQSLKATPSLPLLATSLHSAPILEQNEQSEWSPVEQDKRKTRTSLGLKLGLGTRRRHLSHVEPTSPVDSSPRTSMISGRTKKPKGQIQLTVSYLHLNEASLEFEDDDREVLIRAWCETLGPIRSITSSDPAPGIGELVVLYKRLDNGDGIWSALQSKQVRIRGVGSVTLNWKTL